MNALKSMPASAATQSKNAPRLHIVPAAPASVDAAQPCALADLMRVNRLDRVIIADDLRRIACALFVPAFCFLAFSYEFLGIES